MCTNCVWWFESVKWCTSEQMKTFFNLQWHCECKSLSLFNQGLLHACFLFCFLALHMVISKPDRSCHFTCVAVVCGSVFSLRGSCPPGGHRQWLRIPQPKVQPTKKQQEYRFLQGQAHAERGDTLYRLEIPHFTCVPTSYALFASMCAADVSASLRWGLYWSTPRVDCWYR